MKVKKIGELVQIIFERHDWTNGFAREYIKVIKALPRTTRKYNGTSKSWIVNDVGRNLVELAIAKGEWEEEYPQPTFLSEYDIESWAEQFKRTKYDSIIYEVTGDDGRGS